MDFLSVKGILAMSQTCKAMNQLAGYYLRGNFSDLYYIPALKTLYFCAYNITQTDFPCVENVLMNVENISLVSCNITGKIVDQLAIAV